MIAAEVTVQAQFYDLDPMQVVWHGNYARYLEEARCALLDRIGYNYDEMSASGYMWPIVDMRIKYVRPIRFSQRVLVSAELKEYENRLLIHYRISNPASGEVITKAQTTQVAVDMKTQELCLQSPPALIDKVKALL